MSALKGKKIKKGKKSSKSDTTADTSEIIPLEAGWKKIDETGVQPFLKRIESLDEEKFEKKSIPQEEYGETYDTIFNMCIQREPYNFSDPLYNKHKDALKEYYSSKVIPAIQEGQDKHGLAFLQEWVRRWRDNKWTVDGMRRMFMYLDRFYVPNSEDKLNMSEQGYTLYRHDVFNMFKDAARDAILDCITREREKEMQDRELLKDAVAVYVELGQKLPKVDLSLYQEDFETKFIRATEKYYQVKSRAWLDQDSCPDYMIKAEQCVNEEEERLTTYIHESSKEKLMEATRNELLKKHQDELLAKKSGIGALLEKESKEDLARMYRLYKSVKDGLQPVADAMKAHVAKLGHDYINQSKQTKGPDKEHTLVRNLISLHERFHGIVSNNFENAQVFQKALKEAFEDFINKEYYTSNLLARFINDVLRRGSRVDIKDLDSTLDHVVMLYGYIRDKDVFERDYQLFLSNRLLQGLSQSEQAEKSMIGKLKTECGYQWTSKLEGMFKDVQLSAELMEHWKASVGTTIDVELSVNVCTTGSWPTSTMSACAPPVQLQGVCEKFRTFYLAKHSGRRLQWRLDLGSADIQVNFNDSTKKVLHLTTYQMMVMLLFNFNDKLTYQHILQQTNIPRDDLQAPLLSLAHPKVKVLLKEPNTNKVEDDHVFTINHKYKNNLYRVKIPLLTKLAKSDKQKTAMMKAQQTRRRHQIDAAIVRIMKTRKQLKHMNLLTEVVEQLRQRFQPSGTDIKKRIEALIDQDYLERDEKDRGMYNYKA